MALVGFRTYVGPNERFAPTASEGLEGKTFQWKFEDTPLEAGIIVSAEVIENGLAMDVMVECSDELAARLTPSNAGLDL